MSAAVVPHRNTGPILDATEHDFDLVALLVELFAVAAPVYSVLAWWDARRDAFLLQGGDKPVGVIPPIGNQFGGIGECRQKTSGAHVITHLAF